MGKVFDAGYKCFCKLENLSGGGDLVKIIRFLRIHAIAHKVLYTFERYFPTQQMLESRQYFGRNSERVERIKGWLADEESKQVFEQIITFRQYRRHFPAYTEKDIYFVEGIIGLEPQTNFVDCGAYNGDTIEAFIKRNPDYHKIFAFEPDEENIANIREKIQICHWRDIQLIDCASWSEETTLKFCNQADSRTAGKITEDGAIKVRANSIDNILQGRDCGLIKMDVEGAELESLKGAEKTIMRYRPQLAICIYHKNEDMLEIAEYLHNLVPEYRLYVRHHTCNLGDTVLYAVI